MNYFESQVLHNDQISEDIFVLTASRHGVHATAGQFFMLKCWDNELTLLRPISIFKAEADTLSFMYRLVGEGTHRLARLKPGDPVQLLGALGNGYPIETLSAKSVALVGGGVGIPPLCETAKELSAKNIIVDTFLGFKDDVFVLDDFVPYCRSLFISTETGREGHKGFVTDRLHPEDYDAVFTCGPEIMMRKVAAMCQEKSVPCWCSMEQRMACGIGACLGCSIKTADGMRRVCKDGPVFEAEKVFSI
jgi:dihydroorotate dehydrogenase electron transfer subunit